MIRAFLCPEREWCPLLTLLDASRSGRPDRAPRFHRPAHAYAQTTRRDARLQTQNAARSVTPDRAA
jgi:hypothetical protein